MVHLGAPEPRALEDRHIIDSGSEDTLQLLKLPERVPIQELTTMK